MVNYIFNLSDESFDLREIMKVERIFSDVVIMTTSGKKTVRCGSCAAAAQSCRDIISAWNGLLVHRDEMELEKLKLELEILKLKNR